jgi:hypothetical protein
MTDKSPHERLPHLAQWNVTSPISGERVTHHITGSAKAKTDFGYMGGRTPVHVEDFGQDSALITFRCNETPVMLAVAGENYINLIRELIAHASPALRDELGTQLDEALGLAS